MGISCTNELVEREAMDHMHNWLKLHPEYSAVPILAKPQLSFDELFSAFEECLKIKADDPNLYVSLGVLCFVQKAFKKAISYFEHAVQLNPLDHVLWNRLGAAHANSGDMA